MPNWLRPWTSWKGPTSQSDLLKLICLDASAALVERSAISF